MCNEFEMRNRQQWASAITQAFGESPQESGTCTDAETMIRILTPFMGNNLNHTLFPSGGGLDLDYISHSSELGCLEFGQTPKVAEIFRPGVLSFEHFPQSSWNSFFLLEVEPLPPSGVYKNSHDHEEVVEISPGKYISRSYWDTGSYGSDEYGAEIPLPEASRVVTRYMKGSFLVVANASLWNQMISTYDGRHSGMKSKHIREQVQALIDRSAAN